MIIFKVSHRGFKYDYLLLYFLNWSESFALGLAMLCTIMSQNVVRLGEGLTPQWILSILRLLNYCFGASSVWTDCNAEHLRCYHQSQCHEVQIHHDDLLHRLKDNVVTDMVCWCITARLTFEQSELLSVWPKPQDLNPRKVLSWTAWVTSHSAKATGSESPESDCPVSTQYLLTKLDPGTL